MKFLQRFNHSYRQTITLIGFVVLAFLFRLFLMRYHFAIGWDEPHYLQMAASFAKGRFAQGLHTYWSPMYPVCIAVFSFVFPNLEIAGRMVSMVCGTLVLLPIFCFAKRLFGEFCAFWAIGLLAFSLPLAFFSTEAMADPAFIFFAIMGVYFGWKGIETNSIRFSFLAAVLFGFSYLTKPEGIGFLAIYLAIAGLWGGVEYLKYKKIQKLLIVIVCIVGFFGISGPYLVYLRKETGSWTLNSKAFAAQQLAVQNYSDSKVNYSQLSHDNTLLGTDAIYHQGNFLELVKKNKQPTRRINVSVILKKFSTNFYRALKYTIPRTMGTVMLLLFFLGLFRSIWSLEKISTHLYLLSFVSVFWLFFIPMFFLVDRYFLPGLTICFIWIGKGVVELASWIAESFHPFLKNTLVYVRLKTESKAFILVLIFVFFFSWLPEFAKIAARQKWSPQFWADAVELKMAGLWLKQHVSQPPVLMSVNKSVDFYAGCYDIRKGASFSTDNFERILAYARHRKVEYIVVPERYLEWYPNLEFLFDDTKVPDVLKLVYENREKKGLGVRIFKLINSIK